LGVKPPPTPQYCGGASSPKGGILIENLMNFINLMNFMNLMNPPTPQYCGAGFTNLMNFMNLMNLMNLMNPPTGSLPAGKGRAGFTNLSEN